MFLIRLLKIICDSRGMNYFLVRKNLLQKPETCVLNYMIFFQEIFFLNSMNRIEKYAMDLLLLNDEGPFDDFLNFDFF